MSVSEFSLVLLSAVLHAGWNYLSKTIPSGAPFVWLVAVAMTVLYLPLSISYAIWCGFDATATNALVLLGSGLIHLVYFLVLQKGYQTGDLSVVYPLARGSGPVFTALGAVLFLGERVDARALAGLALVVVGVLFISGLSIRGGQRPAGLWYGLLTGVLIACYTVWDGFAVKQLALAPLLIDATAHPIRILALAPIARRRRDEVRAIWAAHRWKIAVIALVSPLSFILFLYAVQSAPLHVAAPVRELSIVIGVFLGARLLTEADFWPRLTGSLLIVGGICFLAG